LVLRPGKTANNNKTRGVLPMNPFRSAVLATAALLVACSGGVSGEYTDDSGMFTYNFKSGGKVEITTNVFGTSQVQEMDYEFEDGKVKLGPENGPKQILPLDDDGCLDAGGLQGKLCRKKS